MVSILAPARREQPMPRLWSHARAVPAARFLKFVFICLFLALLANNAVCAEKNRRLWNNFTVLEGAAARDFLIGNSTYDRESLHLTFFIDVETAVTGLLGSEWCHIVQWKFADNTDCGDQTFGLGCRSFNVLADLSNGDHRSGSVIGYYLYIDFNARSEERLLRETSYLIRKGNATNCPMPAGMPRIPAVLASIGQASARSTNFVERLPEKPSPLRSLDRLLIGNSVIWPQLPGQPCGRIDYFARNGRIYHFECREKHPDERSDRPSFEVRIVRWRIIRKQFCMEAADTQGLYDDCNLIALMPPHTRTLSTRGEAMMRVFYLGGGMAFAPDSLGPGYIVKGNPARFSLK
jgi:hypothetical protein